MPNNFSPSPNFFNSIQNGTFSPVFVNPNNTFGTIHYGQPSTGFSNVNPSNLGINYGQLPAVRTANLTTGTNNWSRPPIRSTSQTSGTGNWERLPIRPTNQQYFPTNNSFRRPVTSVTPTNSPTLSQWGSIFKYEDFIKSTAHADDNIPHLPNYYPRGKKVNLPNFWNTNNLYSSFITNPTPRPSSLLNAFPNNIEPNLPNFWNKNNLYSSFILNGHGAETPHHLPEASPNGFTANLPNFWNIDKTYSNFIQSNDAIPHRLPNVVSPPGLIPALPNPFNEANRYEDQPNLPDGSGFGSNPNGKQANTNWFFELRTSGRKYEQWIKGAPHSEPGPQHLPGANPLNGINGGQGYGSPNLQSFGGAGNYWNPTSKYKTWYNAGGRSEIFDTTYPYKIGSTTKERDDYTSPDGSLRPRMAVPLSKPHSRIDNQITKFTGNNPADFREAKLTVIGMNPGGTETRYDARHVKNIGATTYVINSKAKGRRTENRKQELEALGYTPVELAGYNPAFGLAPENVTGTKSGVDKNTNIQLENEAARTAAILALNSTAALGAPAVFQLGASTLNAFDTEGVAQNRYATVPFHRLRRDVFEVYADFRAKKGYDDGQVLAKRLDGAAAAARTLKPGGTALSTGALSTLYAAGSASPVGPYGIINLEKNYGFGEHGTPYALRNDFTAKSVAATVWDDSSKPKDGLRPVD